MDKETKVTYVEIDKLTGSGLLQIEDSALEELAESIKEHGVFEPILTDKSYNIIAGERRWKAAKIAGLKEVPVVIKE